MTAYYNENDPKAAAWLRELIKQNLIAPGDVDERSICDVQPDDLTGYDQCHFFAGIGGWSYALRLAGWPDDRQVWTGSCPCQPFSAAGKRAGFKDERHLWPAWFELVKKCRPSVVFGEQVARAIGQGWLDAVADDLERQGYAVGAAVLPAASVSAPHIRERLWFVANTGSTELRNKSGRSRRQNRQGTPEFGAHGATQPMADADSGERHGRRSVLEMGGISSASEVGDDAAPRRITWPLEPDVPRVAHGIPGRVDLLRGYGNAIVPQVAEAFIRAYEEATSPFC